MTYLIAPAVNTGWALVVVGAVPVITTALSAPMLPVLPWKGGRGEYM